MAEESSNYECSFALLPYNDDKDDCENAESEQCTNYTLRAPFLFYSALLKCKEIINNCSHNEKGPNQVYLQEFFFQACLDRRRGSWRLKVEKYDAAEAAPMGRFI